MKLKLISAGALALALVAGGPALAASAHDKAADVTCTAASVSLTNYDQGATALVVVDGATKHEGTFGGRLVESYPLTGNVEHTLAVTVRSVDGAQFNLDYTKTTKGCYTAPPVVIEEIPYPTLIGLDVCGPSNDTVTVDPAWLATYGSLVDGPWIDTNYKTVDGKRVVDGSANIKAELRGKYIWAGTSGKPASDFTRWRMYPGTAPFVYVDLATECPVVIPDPDPETPAEPEQPGTPEQPVDPAEPNEPVTPTQPSTPADPAAPAPVDSTPVDATPVVDLVTATPSPAPAPLAAAAGTDAPLLASTGTTVEQAHTQAVLAAGGAAAVAAGIVLMVWRIRRRNLEG